MNEKTKQETYDRLLAPINSICDELYIRKNFKEGLTKALEQFRTDLAKALKKGFPIDYIPPEPKSDLGKKTIFVGKKTLFHRAISLGWAMISNYYSQAEKEDYYDTLRFMLDNGANVNIKDSRNFNVLMSLIEISNWNIPIDIFRNIVAKTEDLEHVGDDKFQASHRTAFQLWVGYYLYYREEGAKVDIEVKNIWEMLTVLIDAGADCDIDESEYAQEERELVKELKGRIKEYTEYKETTRRTNKEDLEIYER